jgi:hypothetical protein
MVARPHNQNEESDGFDADDFEDVHILTEEEAWEFFNDQVLRTLGISGEEFLRRWDNNQYQPVPDTPEGRKISGVAMLIPFGRPTFT